MYSSDKDCEGFAYFIFLISDLWVKVERPGVMCPKKSHFKEDRKVFCVPDSQDK